MESPDRHQQFVPLKQSVFGRRGGEEGKNGPSDLRLVIVAAESQGRDIKISFRRRAEINTAGCKKMGGFASRSHMSETQGFPFSPRG